MAEEWTEDDVWKEIGLLGQEVAEQTKIIQKLRRWEEAERRYQTDREATLKIKNADIERTLQRKLRELKREWESKQMWSLSWSHKANRNLRSVGRSCRSGGPG